MLCGMQTTVCWLLCTLYYNKIINIAAAQWKKQNYYGGYTGRVLGFESKRGILFYLFLFIEFFLTPHVSVYFTLVFNYAQCSCSPIPPLCTSTILLVRPTVPRLCVARYTIIIIYNTRRNWKRDIKQYSALFLLQRPGPFSICVTKKDRKCQCTDWI